MSKLPIALLAGLLALVFPFVLPADNSTAIPGYTIHHNALTTDNLPIQVANAYDIQRSKTRGLLNVSVLRDDLNGPGTPVRAEIIAVARTLYGQIRPLDMREVVEGEAIYYLADFPVAHREILNFDLEILPEGGRYPLRANMRQEFYTD